MVNQLIEIVGFACIVVAAWAFSPLLGLVVLGAGLIAAANT